ncbi:hypothetical protein [Desulforapulum autotrophicum]|nr:hypothetical protein [Desulforapulum autotrophicum]
MYVLMGYSYPLGPMARDSAMALTRGALVEKARNVPPLKPDTNGPAPGEAIIEMDRIWLGLQRTVFQQR